jgi:hypothetical protein
MDELFVHQIPEPLPNTVVHQAHWRESLFFIIHPRDALGDVVILTMAHFPARGELDVLQLGHLGGQPTIGRHVRDAGDDPHTLTVGPVRIDIAEPFKTVNLHVDTHPAAPVSMDLTFTARTRAYGLRRGTMKAGYEIIWDQSHMVQSGVYNGTVTRRDGHVVTIDDWWGQRDHSWGIREHARCPFWMWLAIQLPDGMLAVWNWELPNGARVFTDGCWSPADGGDPVPVVGFTHALHWTNAAGDEVSYERDGLDVAGLAGEVEFELEGGKRIAIDAEGTWAQRYGPVGGGLSQCVVRTRDGRQGTAIYELTGAFHHRYFPVARADRLPPDGLPTGDE